MTRMPVCLSFYLSLCLSVSVCVCACACVRVDFTDNSTSLMTSTLCTWEEKMHAICQPNSIDRTVRIVFGLCFSVEHDAIGLAQNTIERIKQFWFGYMDTNKHTHTQRIARSNLCLVSCDAQTITHPNVKIFHTRSVHNVMGSNGVWIVAMGSRLRTPDRNG